MGPDGIQMAEALLGSLSSALTGALAEVFAISATVIAMSVGASLFLRLIFDSVFLGRYCIQRTYVHLNPDYSIL